MIKFLPSYVGSKAYWLNTLFPYLSEAKIAEPFCGSCVISANLASEARLNDLDPMVYKIMSEFESLAEFPVFTKDDFSKFRKESDWWKYAYYFQKMSFSGVFRYSKNGYNVPIKPNLEKVEILSELLLAKQRMKELNPTVTNTSYINIPPSSFSGWSVVLDPPYEGSQASYNTSFNYTEYWDYVEQTLKSADTTVIFDRESNLSKFGSSLLTRKMRVNGKRVGDKEAVYIHNNIELKKQPWGAW